MPKNRVPTLIISLVFVVISFSCPRSFSFDFVDQLISELSDSDPGKRAIAAWDLGINRIEKAVDPLIKVLHKDENWYVRLCAGKALDRIGNPRVINDLIRALYDPERKVRDEVSKVLANFGESAIEYLIQALNAEDVLVRNLASRQLLAIGNFAVEPLLQAFLNDSSLEVKSAAALVLGNIRDKRAIKPLVQHYDDRGLIHDVVYALQTMGPPAVDAVVELLQSDPDAHIRRNAAAALAYIGGEDSVKPRLQALSDPDPEVRKISALSLSFRRDPSLIKPMCYQLSQSNLDQKTALKIVRLIGKPAILELISLLGHFDEKIRDHVVDLLVDLGDLALKDLILALGIDHHLTHITVLSVLELMGNSAMEALISELQAPEEHRRYLAAEALGKFRDPKAIDALVCALQTLFLEVSDGTFTHTVDPNFRVKNQVEAALIHIGEPAIERIILASDSTGEDQVKSLINSLKRFGKVAIKPLLVSLNDVAPRIRRFSIQALGEIGDSSTLEHLMKSLKDPNHEIRAAVAHALGELKDPKAISALVENLIADTSTENIAVAAKALVKIGPPSVETFLSLLKYSVWTVRVDAAWALGEIGDRKAVEPLVEVLKDTHSSVRKWAAKSLALFQDQRAIEVLMTHVGAVHVDTRDEVFTIVHVYANSEIAEALIRIGPPAIGHLISALESSSDWKIRHDAAYALGGIGGLEVLIPLLGAQHDSNTLVRDIAKYTFDETLRRVSCDDTIKLLNHEEWQIRYHAAKFLGSPRNFIAVSYLKKALSDGKEEVRKAVQESLNIIRSQEALEDFLSTLLTNLDEIKRADAATHLSYFDPKPEILESLVLALGDPQEIVQQNAKKSIFSIGEASLEALIKGAKSPEFLVRLNVAKILGQFKNEQAARALVDLLHDSNINIYGNALSSLLQIGRPAAGALRETIEHSKSEFVKKYAAETLRIIETSERLEKSSK